MYSLIIYYELVPFLLQIKVFCSKLNRTNASILVILNCPKMWWRKRDSKVTFSIYDITITVATERILNAWIYYYTKIRCKNKVSAGRWMVWKMVLSIIWEQPAVDVMVSSSFPILSLRSKEYRFEHFSLKSSGIIKVTGLRLIMLLLRLSRKRIAKGLELFTVFAREPK